MSYRLIDGQFISMQIKDEAAEQVKLLKAKDIQPTLAVVLVGENPASKVYVRNKKKACEYVGIKSISYELPENTSEEELLHLISNLNIDGAVHGILVQLPLPKHIDENKIIMTIDPTKDVDSFHPINAGKLLIGQKAFLPCTPAGIIEMLKRSNIDIAGKNCVIVGRSNIVGKPAAILMLQENATVTVCHSKTKDLIEQCHNADILIAAIGRAKFITADYVKPGAVLIDVGINRTEDGKLCGDIDFEDCCNISSAITPVPKGVGPMTIAMLMKNCVEAAISSGVLL